MRAAGRQRWGEAKGERSRTAKELTSDLKAGVKNCFGREAELEQKNKGKKKKHKHFGSWTQIGTSCWKF